MKLLFMGSFIYFIMKELKRMLFLNVYANQGSGSGTRGGKGGAGTTKQGAPRDTNKRNTFNRPQGIPRDPNTGRLVIPRAFPTTRKKIRDTQSRIKNGN
jgi:hypothetical protein